MNTAARARRHGGEQAYQGCWSAVVDFLRASDIRTVFGLPGDDLELLRALTGTTLRMVLCRDQRNAVFMATGNALVSGRPAACVVGKGPATTNAVTGLLEAAYSGAPLLLFTSGTAADRRGAGAFQEVDQLALVGPLVRWACRVDHPDRLVPTLEKALSVATGPAPGPVCVELPDHLLTADIVRGRSWAQPPQQLRHFDPARLDGEALRALRASRRPLVLAGGGLRHGNAGRVVERFAEQLGAGLFATASGRGAVAEDHALFCGLAGLYAPPETAELWRRTDLVIALGSRLEETATYGWDAVPQGTEVLQVNVEPADFRTEFPGPRVLGDAAGAAAGWTARLSPADGQPAHEETASASGGRNPSWRETVRGVRAAVWAGAGRELERMAAAPELHVAEVLDALHGALPADHVLVQENGLQDMWSYHYPYYSTGSSGGSVVPSEQTSLGFGAAAAAGVKLAVPERAVVALAGDGAVELFRSDLGTLVQGGIGVLYLVLHNGGYGWLESQLRQHGGPVAREFSFASDTGPLPSGRCVSGVPGVPGVAGVHTETVTKKGELPPALSRALQATEGHRVAVVHVAVRLADVPPKVADANSGSVPQ